MQPLPQPERTARVAAQVLSHDVAQWLPYRAVEVLRAIERQDADIHPADADRVAHLALQVAITAEIAAMRQAEART